MYRIKWAPSQQICLLQDENRGKHGIMRIGLGTTALVKGIAASHVDGIGAYTRSLLEGLDKLPSEKIMVNFGHCDTFASQSLFPGNSKICLPLPYSSAAALSCLTSLPFPGTGKLQGKIDLFHAPDHHIPSLGKIPVVATVMDAIPLAHPEWASKRLRTLKNAIFRQMVRSTQRIITISEYSKANIVHFFGIPAERISVTYLGVDPAFAQPLSHEVRMAVLARYGLQPGYFVFVGTLQPRKNLTRIIEAHRMLPMEIQKTCPLIVIGRNGWGTDALLPELGALESRGCGRWLNNVEDAELHALLQSARALVYPSLYEGFGLPVLEGFAAGLPVISSNTTSIPEVAGDAALLVNPEHSAEIAAAMLRLVEDDALAADLVERGRLRVKNFTWGNCLRQTVDVYKELVN